MAIAILHELPGGTQEQYDEITRGLNSGGMRRLSDWPAPGVLCHIAGPVSTGWRVVDVWESEDAFRRFGEVLMPQLEAAGVEARMPEVYPVHNFVKD
jgi:hypothetical protein